MHTSEIADKVMRIKKIKSKTPRNSVVNILQTSKYIIRVNRGLYQYKA
jgi:hypothetical protein